MVVATTASASRIRLLFSKRDPENSPEQSGCLYLYGNLWLLRSRTCPKAIACPCHCKGIHGRGLRSLQPFSLQNYRRVGAQHVRASSQVPGHRGECVRLHCCAATRSRLRWQAWPVPAQFRASVCAAQEIFAVASCQHLVGSLRHA